VAAPGRGGPGSAGASIGARQRLGPGRIPPRRLGAALGALACLPALPAAAQEVICRLALVLAIDVSSSVDAQEDLLQRQGLASALTAPEVVSAFLRTDLPVALAAFEWSGRWNQTVLLDWRLIRSEADLAQAAARIASSRRSTREFPTAMGYALGFAARMLRDAPRCLMQTVDVSGDGITNDGFGPRAAYREFGFEGVTVNGLAIEVPEPAGREISVRTYYAEEVLHGPLAFLELAAGFGDFERAMRRKLEREVGAQAIGRLEGAGR
jgi:hypothetical protein